MWVALNRQQYAAGLRSMVGYGHKFARISLSTRKHQRGISGLETAIVLIAFVVVSSVFAFASLSSGLFSADKSKETIHAGLSQASGTLQIKGSVVARASITGDSGVVNEITFQVTNSVGGEAVNVRQGETVIKYTDDSQTLILDTASEFSITALGNADSDNLVEKGEMYEISITGLAASLSPDLSTADTFTVQVMVPQGAVLFIERTTPIFLETFNTLN